jgi:predicted RNA-binding Zn-ribbon protein involved in translation (DUF1610 family)
MTATDAVAKSTLFCPDCGHRSRFDGDWTLVETGRGIRYVCPECGRGITVRSPAGAEDGGAGPFGWWQPALETWETTVRTWGEFWQELLTSP